MAREKYPVVLYFQRGLDKRHAEQVSDLFARHSGPVTVRVGSRGVTLDVGPDGLLSWVETFGAIRHLRASEQISPDTFIYLLTNTPNENNWFAVEDPENMRNGFGHVGEFSWVTSAPDYVVTSHYLLKAIFNAIVNEAGLDWKQLWHIEARGCFFDFCQQKWELGLKLRTADICGDCMNVFQSIGIPDALLAQAVRIMEATRRMALNTGQYLPAEAVFNDWPFPVAITRHKAVQATKPLLRFMLLLDHFDSLVRYFFLAHETLADHQITLVDRPTLGWWIDQLAHSLQGERHFREVVNIAEKENVIALRNEKRGHGWMAANEEAYREEATKLEQVLENIEDELRPFLETHRLVVPRDLQLRDGGYLVEGDILIGSHILHPKFEKMLHDPRAAGLTQQNEIYLTDGNMEQFRKISPFIRTAICPTCRHPRVLITDGGRQYIDVLVGHRVEL